MAVALVIVVMTLAFVAWRSTAQARARSTGRRSASRRGTHRRPPTSPSVRGPVLPSRGRREVQQRPPPGRPVVIRPPEHGAPPAAATVPYATGHGSAQHRIPEMPTSSMAPALPVVGQETHMPPGPVRPQATGQTAPSRSYSAAVQRAAGDVVWVPAGQLVRIGGCSISGGLIYVGRELAAVTGGGPDPALIDPGLGIDHQVADYAGAKMGYWPSYSRIAPACRAAYLQWLADGRHAPHAYIGYVFLYFYGLERRLLVDEQKSASARSEREILLTEVRRLIGIYGTNGSFRGYAEGLLAYMTADDAQRRYLSSPPARRHGWEVPFELRLGLGQLAADARPVPADWALAWLRLHPEGWLRTPATRCPAEFDEVFTRRYHERYGAGLQVEPGSAVLAEVVSPGERRDSCLAPACGPGATGRRRPQRPSSSASRDSRRGL